MLIPRLEQMLEACACGPDGLAGQATQRPASARPWRACGPQQRVHLAEQSGPPMRAVARPRSAPVPAGSPRPPHAPRRAAAPARPPARAQRTGAAAAAR